MSQKSKVDAFEVEHERYLEVLAKLQQAEGEKVILARDLQFLQGILQRPFVANMNDEQVQKMNELVAGHLTGIINQLISKIKGPLLN